MAAEAGAAEPGAAAAALVPTMHPPLAPAGAAAVEIEKGVARAAAAEAVECGPTAAAEEEAAVPAAAVPAEWPGSAALLAGRSGERVAVKVGEEEE